jgi:hypothetical protein
MRTRSTPRRVCGFAFCVSLQPPVVIGRILICKRTNRPKVRGAWRLQPAFGLVQIDFAIPARGFPHFAKHHPTMK